MRVVSLACSNTEIVCALGCAELLVGVDDHSDYPPEVVARLPRLGPDLEIDVERVTALRPDLVLASLTVPGHERVVERVAAARLPYLAPAPQSLDDVYQSVIAIAARLEVEERGAEVVAAMRRELVPALPSASNDVAVEGAPAGERPALLVQWWPKPVISPGGASWVDDLLCVCGARNPLADEQVQSRALEDAEVCRLDPAAFVLSWCGVAPEKVRPDVVLGNPLWQELAAVRGGRVYCVPEALLGRPSPRLVEGARALRRIVTELGAPCGGAL